MKKEMIEDIAVIGGLIAVQFVYAGNSVLLSYLMSIGLNPSTIVIFSTFATFVILSPIAFYFERSKWPNKFSLKLWIQLTLIAFGGLKNFKYFGYACSIQISHLSLSLSFIYLFLFLWCLFCSVTLFQTLFLKGIKLSSPAMATAMPNIAPGLIFLIAWIFRLEKVKISCVYSKVKISGTILCMLGALIMSLMHSTVDPAKEASLTADSKNVIFDKDKIIGCLYLVLAIFVLSSNVVLQATTLSEFPAPISLCAITSLIGVVITTAVQLFQEHTLDIGWPIVSVKNLIGFSILTGAVSGICVSFNGWTIKKRGPVMVSMFNPIGAVCSVILSAITIGDTLSLGSLGGMVLMFTGLYFFLWAKGKEGYSINEDDFENEFDVGKPLLS